MFGARHCRQGILIMTAKNKHIPHEYTFYVKKLNFMYKKYGKLFFEYFSWTYEDYQQELYMVYLKAIKTYSKDRPASVHTHIVNCMRNFIIDTYRKTIRKFRAPLHLLENGGLSSPTYLEKYLNNLPESRYLPEKQFIDEEIRLQVLARLNSEEKIIFVLHFQCGASKTELKRYLKIEDSTLDPLLAKVTSKLQGIYDNG